MSRTLSAPVVALLLLTAANRSALLAQAPPSVVLPAATLRAIATDFDGGRNRLYCYHGVASGESAPVVRVDSVTIVETTIECSGVGIGFISRIEDRPFLINALAGLIESSTTWSVVSAFYQTEIVESGGQQFRGARALSVLRPSPSPKP